MHLSITEIEVEHEMEIDVRVFDSEVVWLKSSNVSISICTRDLVMNFDQGNQCFMFATQGERR